MSDDQIPVSDASGWCLIDSAPKDGRTIIVGNAAGAWVAKYEPVYQSGYRPKNPWFSLMLNLRHIGQYPSTIPTHWMPLPKPPAGGQQP